MASSTRTAAVGSSNSALTASKSSASMPPYRSRRVFLSKPSCRSRCSRKNSVSLYSVKTSRRSSSRSLPLHEQVLLDPLDQGFGLGVGLAGQGGELALVFDRLATKPKSFQGLVDLLQRFVFRLPLAAEPSPGIAGGILFQDVFSSSLLVCSSARSAEHGPCRRACVLGFVRFLQVPPPSSGKGIGAGQEPLGQQRIDELAHPSFRCRGVAQGGMALLAVFPQRSEQGRFLVRHADGNFHRIKLVGERWPKGLLVDVVLEATNADFGQILSCPCRPSPRPSGSGSGRAVPAGR